ANGIVHVSAKDLGTGKEQKIRIESSSGLSEEEIQKMVKDAEAHAQEDKEARAVAEAKNETETLTYSLEKAVAEAGDKITASDKQLAEDEIKRAREAIASGNLDRINSAKDSITKISTEISGKIYGGQTPGGDPGFQGSAGPTGGNTSDSANANGEKVVDADYTVVDEDKK
ncbi:MAG: Hsp70 family protein, partial [Leptospiraceae bacterium]|nr:Hsp70 family protein [Leptospiraceae bacterium]